MASPEGDLVPSKKVIALARTLTEINVPHAFGGAIALPFWSEPRATVDIDVNIFLPTSEAPRVFTALVNLGVAVAPGALRETLDRDQVRLQWEPTPVDLFFAYDPFHDSCATRAASVRFAGEPIRVLSAEDLVIFKTLFNRPKDWLDIEQLLAVQASRIDRTYLHEWLGRMLPPDDPALARLDALLDEYAT